MRAELKLVRGEVSVAEVRQLQGWNLKLKMRNLELRKKLTGNKF